MADVLLVECSMMLEEKFPAILSAFPNVKVKVTCCTKQDIQHSAAHTTTKALFYRDLLCFPAGFPG